MIREYEAQIAKEPNNLKLLRSVAELYSQKKEYERALETYNRIVTQEGASDSSLQKAISETTIKKFDHALSQLDPQSAEYAETMAKLTAERDAFLLADTRQRASVTPTT